MPANTPITTDLTYHLCAISGLIMATLLVVGIWPLAGFIPPPAAYESAETIAAIYRENQNGIIGGSLVIMIGAPFFLLFCLLLSEVMDRLAPQQPLLGRIQSYSAALNALMFIMVGLFWMAAAYRSDAEPTEIRLFNDIAWIIMVVPTVPIILQMLALALAIVSGSGSEREREHSLLPRWLAFFNIWCAITMLPGMLSGFFKTGIIAWHGPLSFWLEGGIFCLWLVVMSQQLLRLKSMDQTL